MLADGVEIQSTIAWFCCRPGAAECALVETAEKALHLMGPGENRKREKESQYSLQKHDSVTVSSSPLLLTVSTPSSRALARASLQYVIFFF